MDGTFQTCPRLFYQIFTIHAFKNGKQFPLVYSLLPNKSRDTYVRLFDVVKQKAISLHENFEPDIILSDFELAIKQAVELSFPVTEFRGCYYHFSQALMRKFQNLGLQVAYREVQEVNQFLRRTAALAFVPVRYVRLAWQALKANAPDQPRMEEFIRYFEDTWLVGQFSLTQWNVFANSSFRTNNHVEGWHNRLKRVVVKSHPNLYELIEVLQREQSANEISLIQLQAGARPPRRALRTINRDRNIEQLKQRFNEIPLEEYIRGMSAHTNVC